jgi:glycosyltransferase involved in cell wall biosynthesis
MGSRRSPNGTSLAERRPTSGPANAGVSASNAERVVFLEFTWKRHLAYDSLLTDPPAGYRFVVGDGRGQHAIKAASRFAPAYSALYALDRLVPVHLLKSYWDARTKPPAGTALTYAVNHLVLRDEPWVLDLPCEHVTNLLGGFRHFQRFRRLVKRVLTADNCRRIIVSIDAGRKALEAALGPDLAEKTDVVYAAVPKKEFAKRFDESKVKLLFVNSGNIPGQFHAKGGKEALEAFLLLRRRYPHVEMVLRSDVPSDARWRLGHVDGLRIIDRVVPWPELEREFMTADIFLLPAHLTPQMAFLDALSYELPVVTTDAWGNAEIVEDGKTGLLVRDSRLASHYETMLPRYFVPPAGSREYRDIVASADPQMIQELVAKLSLLIEDAGLRRTLGSAGRREVEEGRFSIPQRNLRLKCVLDEAIEQS